MSVTVESLAAIEPARTMDELLAAHDEFWDGRDTRHLLHVQWFRQFGRYGLLARDEGRAVGYLLGVVTTGALGYVHAVAVRSGYRRTGLGRRLWDLFGRLAAAEGATELQAITSPGNAASIAFHVGLGMSAREIADYAGAGQPRILFHRAL